MTGKRLRGIDTMDDLDNAFDCVIIGLAMGIFFCSERVMTTFPVTPSMTLDVSGSQILVSLILTLGDLPSGSEPSVVISIPPLT